MNNPVYLGGDRLEEPADTAVKGERWADFSSKYLHSSIIKVWKLIKAIRPLSLIKNVTLSHSSFISDICTQALALHSPTYLKPYNSQKIIFMPIQPNSEDSATVNISVNHYPLADIAILIGEEFQGLQESKQLIKENIAKSLIHAKTIGELLLKVKAQLPHGAWMLWLCETCPFISETSARGYMRVADNWDFIEKTATIADPPMTYSRALKLIADGKGTKKRNNRPLGIEETPTENLKTLLCEFSQELDHYGRISWQSAVRHRMPGLLATLKQTLEQMHNLKARIGEYVPEEDWES